MRLYTLLSLFTLAACQCDPDLAVIPGGVEGQVCAAADGAPLGAARVTLDSADGKQHESVTDGLGRYEFARVFPGAATVTVDGRTFDTMVSSREVAIVTDQGCGEVRPRDTGTVEGAICNRHTGTTVRDALVTLILTDGDARETTTGDDGSFRIEEAPPGTHVLVVQATGFERSFVVEVRAGETTTLDLADGCSPTGFDQGTLSGALCDPDDAERPLIGATVTAFDAAGDTVTDLTDLEGDFFLNALAPGPARVEVSRGSQQLHSYFVDVVAGRDTTVALDLSCAAECSYGVSAVSTVTTRPVDIIFVIDDSGSMDDDNDAVGTNINAFSSRISSSGVDAHVVLVGTTNVPPPLGASASFLQIDTSVDSNDALIELVQHYGAYQGFLRADSVKHFIAITDDESDMSATEFTQIVSSWPGFEEWTFHSIVAYGPDPDEGCSTGAAYGHQYVELSAQSSGLTSPICGADYQAVFETVVTAVVNGSLPCSIAIPAPSGMAIDPTRVYVTYSGAGGEVQATPTCSGPGWRLDDALAPTAVEACPQTCEALSEDVDGTVRVDVGCFAD